MNSQMAIRMVESMGGAPTPISWGELYSALQQGIVDGAENNPPSFLTNKHYEVCKHFTLDGHTRIPDMLIVSDPMFKDLSSEERMWLEKSAKSSSLFQRKLWMEKSVAALKEMQEEHGVTVYHVDTQAFKASIADMLESVSGTAVGDYLDMIQEVL
jgi:TRAP-type C4-dicarboxylate transport system substrate-binding protein